MDTKGPHAKQSLTPKQAQALASSAPFGVVPVSLIPVLGINGAALYGCLLQYDWKQRTLATKIVHKWSATAVKLYARWKEAQSPFSAGEPFDPEKIFGLKRWPPRCYVSQGKAADDLGWSRRKLQRVLRMIEQQKMIWTLHHGRSGSTGGNFGGRSSSYTVFRSHPALKLPEGSRIQPGDPIESPILMETRESTVRVPLELVKAIGPGAALCFGLIQRGGRNLKTPYRERDFPSRAALASTLRVSVPRVSQFLAQLTALNLIPPAINRKTPVKPKRVPKPRAENVVVPIRTIAEFSLQAMATWCRERAGGGEAEQWPGAQAFTAFDFEWIRVRLKERRISTGRFLRHIAEAKYLPGNPVAWHKRQADSMPTGRGRSGAAAGRA
jgi:hypothetical protein